MKHLLTAVIAGFLLSPGLAQAADHTDGSIAQDQPAGHHAQETPQKAKLRAVEKKTDTADADGEFWFDRLHPNLHPTSSEEEEEHVQPKRVETNPSPGVKERPISRRIQQ